MKTPVIIHYKDNGEGSDEDLRITVRSFHENLRMGPLVISGDLPSWASREILHVPFDHPYRKNKDANIAGAIIKAGVHLMNLGHKGEVIVASDDCAVMKPIEVGLYYEEKADKFLEGYVDRAENNRWWGYPLNSIAYCMRKGWKHDHCDAHVPQRVSTGAILTLLDVPFGEKHYGVKSLLVNAEHTYGSRPEPEKPLRVHPKVISNGGEINDDIEFCNWCGRTGTPEFIKVMKESFFTEPCPYEEEYTDGY